VAWENKRQWTVWLNSICQLRKIDTWPCLINSELPNFCKELI
jgi:hypothetical protein